MSISGARLWKEMDLGLDSDKKAPTIARMHGIRAFSIIVIKVKVGKDAAVLGNTRSAGQSTKSSQGVAALSLH